MNGIGRFIRRAFLDQRLHSLDTRRHFISSASLSSSTTTTFLGRRFDRSGLASSVSDSPFGKCGVLNGQKRGLKGLCKFKGKSAGRNFQGRITIFHRGGGAKRLQRRIDLKRSTMSMGVVERVEYDPNRSARIALVRWTSEMQVPRQTKVDTFTPMRKTIDPATADIRGVFSFSSLPGNRKVDEQAKKMYPKDFFLSAFSSRNGSGDKYALPLPRIAIAGANPAFLASRMTEKLGGKEASSVCEVQKCRPSNSIIWSHRIKRQAAVSWHSSRQKETLGIFTHQKPAVAKKTAQAKSL